uniref:Putative serine/threonine-protein kinase pknB n=1 Tax=Anthurium amnicola TaxID=1678845 RepID=A0A1D1Z9K9_9ARAE
MEGKSPDHMSAGSWLKRSSVSSGRRLRGSSSSGHREFLQNFVDSQILTEKLQNWFSAISLDSGLRKPAFDVPFELTELQKFDYALEGVPFQQLIRMPNAPYGTTSDAIEVTAYLALEDFLHASVKGLWETFWGQDVPMPFSVACLHGKSSKFYPAEKAIASGKLDGLCATAISLKNNRHSHGKWAQVVELALLRPDIGTLSVDTDQQPSLSLLGEALFYALHVLLSRSLSRSSSIACNSDCCFVLLVDSQFGGVVKIEGDINKLDFDATNVYESAAEWIKDHSLVKVSPVDRIWNKLGNANWGDIGTLQVLLATFQCIIQFCGVPKHSLEDLAGEHSSHLQSRRTERQLVDTNVNANGLFRFQQFSVSPEIVEVQVQDGFVKIDTEESLKLDVGTILWLDDLNRQKGFQINEVLSDGELPVYCVSATEEPGKALFLYVGSPPSHLEPTWEDMNLWYHVQRQTKMLTLMKQRGLSSKYLPQLVASGRIIHPGECNKPSSNGKCGHPWCGTPILVTSPVGDRVSDLVKNGLFGSDEAIRCCHDCLSALSIAASAGIQHGDIRLENVVRVSYGVKHCYVLIGWGHAVLEDRDRPSMNLFFSSTYALQEGRMCAASDAESLIYLLYFSSGGVYPNLDSVEGALQWRETSWSRRVIQQKLGDISAILKAFADYVDSLCGTPYPIDYDIWLRRLRRTMNDEDHGKDIDVSS